MINLTTDQYFHIGQTHLAGGKPCQDYTIAGVHERAAFAVVADGCSTGGHTDVGARILALSTAVAICEHWTITRAATDETVPQEVNVRQKVVLAGTRQTLGLQSQDMLATCVYAYLTPNGGFVHVQGDGVIAIQYRSGLLVMSRFDWEDNTPFYPAYSEAGLQSFIRKHGSNLDASRFSEETWICDENGEFSSKPNVEHSLSVGIRGVTKQISSESLNGDIAFVAVFSDGVTQIDEIDWKRAVQSFMTFKNTAGEFAKRRMIRGIKDTQKAGKGPLDDIAYAVIRVEETFEEN